MSGQEVIVKLGDRRNSGFCLKCGALLMHPYNDYQCCSECTKFIESCIEKIKQKQKMANKQNVIKKRKVGGTYVVDKRNIMRQVSPIGVPTK